MRAKFYIEVKIHQPDADKRWTRFDYENGLPAAMRDFEKARTARFAAPHETQRVFKSVRLVYKGLTLHRETW